MIYGLYNTIFVVAVLMTIGFLVASVALYFIWDIPNAIKELRQLTSKTSNTK